MKNNISLSYPFETFHDDDGVTVTFPDLPFGVTCGSTYEEAIKNADDCLEHIITMFFSREEKIPMPVKRDGLPEITLSDEMSEEIRKHNDSLGDN